MLIVTVQSRKTEMRKKYSSQPLEFLKPISEPMTQSLYMKFAKSKEAGDFHGFIVVRHPFDRLVSAFRDKLERLHAKTPETDYYYKTHGSKIVGRYRTEALNRFGKKYFSEANNFGAPIPVNTERTADMPMFWEFAKYVLDSNPAVKMDVHWRPAYLHCSVCKMSYDVIVKFENLAFESHWVKKNVLKVTEGDLSSGIPIFNKNQASNVKNDELTLLYFNLLTDDEILALYNIYKFDFQLFGYEFRIRNLTLA